LLVEGPEEGAEDELLRAEVEIALGRRGKETLLAFRSHSKGSLKRLRDKLDHARMTKGSGQAVLNLMLRDRILSIDGSMYVLDPDKLAACAGANYADCMARQFNDKTIEFVRRALHCLFRPQRMNAAAREGRKCRRIV